MTILAVCAAFLSGISLTAGTAAGDTLPECSASPWTMAEPVELPYHDLWTYTYTVTWCAENGRIVWAVPVVGYLEHNPGCDWHGNVVKRVWPDEDSDTWTTFDMSKLTCPAEDDTGARGVTPWAEVMIYPDGNYVVLGKDIAE